MRRPAAFGGAGAAAAWAGCRPAPTGQEYHLERRRDAPASSGMGPSIKIGGQPRTSPRVGSGRRRRCASALPRPWRAGRASSGKHLVSWRSAGPNPPPAGQTPPVAATRPDREFRPIGSTRGDSPPSPAPRPGQGGAQFVQGLAPEQHPRNRPSGCSARRHWISCPTGSFAQCSAIACTTRSCAPCSSASTSSSRRARLREMRLRPEWENRSPRRLGKRSVNHCQPKLTSSSALCMKKTFRRAGGAGAVARQGGAVGQAGGVCHGGKIGGGA